LQSKKIELQNDEIFLKKIWNYFIFKGKSANFIIGMFYVGHFSM
jgi:hypothetical protein